MIATTWLRRTVLVLMAAGPVPLGAQVPARVNAQARWADVSPHVVRTVRVAPGVRLEVLDWGGKGAPLVFLAGGGNTAHVYDGFAPRFTSRFRVFGITRRGVGASAKPLAGYDSGSLATDIVAVLDSLRLSRGTFVAHSFGGSELNALATRYPARVERLIYLDAAFDYRAILDSPEWASGRLQTPQPPIPAYDDNTARSWTLFAERLSGPGYPEAEVRSMYIFDARGRYVGARRPDSLFAWYFRGVAPVDLQRVRAPTLAIYAQLPSTEGMFPFWATLDSTARAAAEMSFNAVTTLQERLRAQFREAVPHARVVYIPGARHYVFLTHPGEVEHAMLELLLSPAPRS
jgi:non-heme chloroperoxidase